MVVVAIATATVIVNQPMIGLAIPALAVAALLCSRRPLVAIIVLLALSGTYGSIQAFTGFSVDSLAYLIIAGLAVAVLANHMTETRSRPLRVWPSVALFVLYVILTALEVLVAPDPAVALNAFLILGLYMLLVPVLAFAGWRYATYERLAKAMVVIAAVVAAYATFRWIVGPASAELSNALVHRPLFSYLGSDFLLIGSLGSRAELGFWVAVMAPFCLAFSLGFSGRWRTLAFVTCGLCLTALIGTHLREGLPAVVIGGVVVLVVYNLSGAFPSGVRLGGTALALVGAVMIGASLYVGTIAGGENGTSPYGAIFHPSNDPSFQARISKWNAAMNDISDHPFGLGLGTAGPTQERGDNQYFNVASQSLDSTYLEVAYQQGLVVMAYFALVLAALVVALGRGAVFASDRRPAAIAAGAAAALAAAMSMFVTAEFLVGLIAVPLWVAIGTAIGALGASEGALGESAARPVALPGAE